MSTKNLKITKKSKLIVRITMVAIVIGVLTYFYFKNNRKTTQETKDQNQNKNTKMKHYVKDLKLSQKGINFIKKEEGLYSMSPFGKPQMAYAGYQGFIHAYLDPVGIPTIGYGHTKGVQLGRVITVAQAEKFLIEDVQDAENIVRSKIKVKLTQNQFDALVSHTFNVTGYSENLMKLVNGADTVTFKGAEYDLKKWWTKTYTTGEENGVRKELPGLVRRRKEEYEMFMA